MIKGSYNQVKEWKCNNCKNKDKNPDTKNVKNNSGYEKTINICTKCGSSDLEWIGGMIIR